MCIAERAEVRDESSPEAQVDAMYAGPKAHFRPIDEALVEPGLKTGKDVRTTVCKTIVPFHRRHVFAPIKPTTNTRVDFSFALDRTDASRRLIYAGCYAKKDRLTRRIPIASSAELKRDPGIAGDITLSRIAK